MSGSAEAAAEADPAGAPVGAAALAGAGVAVLLVQAAMIGARAPAAPIFATRSRKYRRLRRRSAR